MSDATAGPDSSPDIGALSRIGDPERRSAAGLARRGKVYDLGLEMGAHVPHNSVFVRYSSAFISTPEGSGAISPFQYSAEVITGTLHVSTHIDAFIHVQAEDRIYGGGLAKDARDDRAWKKFGMETVPPIVGRAVVLDAAAVRGVSKLEDGYEITIDDVKEALKRASQEIRQGDIVLVRTGKILDFGDEAAFQAAEPGVGREAAIWLYDQGMAVLGTDTTGTEPQPFKDAAATTHRAMLVDRGVHLIENLDMEALARDRIGEGFFVCLPIKLTGATGSWVRPILMV